MFLLKISLKIPKVVQKIQNFSSSTLAVFINVTNFLKFTCGEETNDVSIKQMMPDFLL